MYSLFCLFVEIQANEKQKQSPKRPNERRLRQHQQVGVAVWCVVWSALLLVFVVIDLVCGSYACIVCFCMHGVFMHLFHVYVFIVCLCMYCVFVHLLRVYVCIVCLCIYCVFMYVLCVCAFIVCLCIYCVCM